MKKVQRKIDPSKTNHQIEMKTKNLISTMLMAAAFAGLLAACASTEEKQAKLQAEARVTRADAEHTALARVPNGTVKEGELEKEHGKLF